MTVSTVIFHFISPKEMSSDFDVSKHHLFYECRQKSDTKHDPKYYKYKRRIVHQFKNIDGISFLVHIDVYDLLKNKNDVYVLKFFRKADKNKGREKFKQILNLKDSRTVLKTCVELMRQIYIKDQESCLMVHGIPTIEDVIIETNAKKYNRNRETSRRFRIYQLYAARYFSEDDFHHQANKSKNTLLVFSNKLNKDKIVSDIENTFIMHYPTCAEYCCLPSSPSLN